METEFITPNGDAQAAAISDSRRPTNFWLIIIAALFIIVPFLTWYLTWFGRALSDEDVATYLADEKNPRHLQHALSQVAERIEDRKSTRLNSSHGYISYAVFCL